MQREKAKTDNGIGAGRKVTQGNKVYGDRMKDNNGTGRGAVEGKAEKGQGKAISARTVLEAEV